MLMLKAIFNISMYVCCCAAVTDSEIADLIADGVRSVETITACTGAGSRCGSCRPEIAGMIAAHEQRADRAALLVQPSEGGRRSDGRVHLAVGGHDVDHEGHHVSRSEERRSSESEAPASAA